jgi:hypothetical protein
MNQKSEAQRRKSMNSPWRRGPQCATKKAVKSWEKIQGRREKELGDG